MTISPDLDADRSAPGAYRLPIVGLAYDLINAVIWLPGGVRRLRRSFVADLDVGPGCRVIELGCGTGAVTARLVEAGAEVTAVDRAGHMLARARRRAASASFVQRDLEDIDAAAEAPFDRVVLAFVLHELDAEGRRDALRLARSLLRPGGRVGVLEWDLPASGARRTLWRTMIRTIEREVPTDVVGGALPGDLADAGLSVVRTQSRAGGRAQVIVAERPAS